MEVPIHAPAGRAGLPDAIDPLSPLLNLDKPLLYALRGNEAAEAGSEIHSVRSQLRTWYSGAHI